MGRNALALDRAWSLVHSTEKEVILMSTVEKTIATMLSLVALYLLLANYKASVAIMQGLSASINPTLKTLQGR